mmetsp:Transcript_80782/g.142316  ORF Transcript_80782/g.142316 Transcript_80782/m.142316 type:complete len:584 (-) Transcript_80782:459-2210(-)
MTTLITPPTSPPPNAVSKLIAGVQSPPGQPPSPCSIWAPVEEELEALSLGWDDAAFKEKLLKVRATTPPAFSTNVSFPSLASPATTAPRPLPATDPRPSTLVKAPRPEREVPRRRLFPEGLPRSESPVNGGPTAALLQAKSQRKSPSSPRSLLNDSIPSPAADVKAPENQPPSLASSLLPLDASFGSTVANSSLGYSQSFTPADMGNMSPHHMSGNMSPQNLNLSGSMSPLSNSNDNSYASMNGGNVPSTQMFAPPQNQQQGLPMNHLGAFSPTALPPNTVLVPAEDPSNPGNTLFRLVTIDPNNPHPHVMQPGMQPQQNIGYEQENMPNMSMNGQQQMMPNMNGHGMNNTNGHMNGMNNGMMPGHNNMEQTMYMANPNNSNVPLPIIMCPKIYCLVEFKRGRTLQYESANYVAPGEYVIVGGDRGEDLGMVVHTWVAPAHGSEDGERAGNGSPPHGPNGASSPTSGGSTTDRSLQYDNFGNPLPTNDQPMGRVIRRATPKEVQHLHSVQTELEKRCTEVCQQKVIEHGLVLVVVDAEYQFDRKKLTFYYDAAERQDFRDLVRDLYKTYRARIWMSKVNNNHR